MTDRDREAYVGTAKVEKSEHGLTFTMVDRHVPINLLEIIIDLRRCTVCGSELVIHYLNQKYGSPTDIVKKCETHGEIFRVTSTSKE